MIAPRRYFTPLAIVATWELQNPDYGTSMPDEPKPLDVTTQALVTPCVWKRSEVSARKWVTDCGRSYRLDGIAWPSYHSFHFCPGCGHPLTEASDE